MLSCRLGDTAYGAVFVGQAGRPCSGALVDCDLSRFSGAGAVVQKGAGPVRILGNR